MIPFRKHRNSEMGASRGSDPERTVLLTVYGALATMTHRVRFIFRLVVCMVVASAAGGFLLTSRSLLNGGGLSGRPGSLWFGQGGWRRSSIGALSLATPCALHPVSAPDKPDTANFFSFSEHIGGEYAGCVIAIHHAELRYGRDAFALAREIFGKAADMGKTLGARTIQEMPVLVNGTRGDRASFSFNAAKASRRRGRKGGLRLCLKWGRSRRGGL
jgi:hypothetical protein